MDKLQKKWFVFYTKSRQEKKTRDLLIRNGFEVYLPLQKVMRQWSDRKKKVEAPLFNSYIFVLEVEYKISMILQTPGVAWNIRFNSKPAVLRTQELETIERTATGPAVPIVGQLATIITAYKLGRIRAIKATRRPAPDLNADRQMGRP